MPDNFDMTLREFLNFAKKCNAGSAKLIMRKSDGKPVAAFIALNGEQPCEDLLPIIEKIEDEWNQDSPGDLTPDAADACPSCGGHGADPMSDNVNWLPCSACGGTGKRR